MERETLTVFQLYRVDKRPILYGTRKFITMYLSMFFTQGCKNVPKI